VSDVSDIRPGTLPSLISSAPRLSAAPNDPTAWSRDRRSEVEQWQHLGILDFRISSVGATLIQINFGATFVGAR
jgi:hypothetical protein